MSRTWEPRGIFISSKLQSVFVPLNNSVMGNKDWLIGWCIFVLFYCLSDELIDELIRHINSSPNEKYLFIFFLPWKKEIFLAFWVIYTECMVQRETVLFSCFVIHLDFSQNSQMAKTNKLAIVFGTQATTMQLYLGQDTFEFYQGHMTKNQPMIVLIV